MKYFLYYLIAINLITFFAFGIDKRRAEKGAWRTKESTLLGLAAIGGLRRRAARNERFQTQNKA